ncbi:TetR/AcrR family transcriptional regulator [Rhodococcus sp. IEGM 1366]|uniref:TetR/AcrR family transcriptional regulator n=1 Tax=Rhodococcus sp. IEGM 1366 TaxID=3082223 RepID=UPI00295374C8|nr:TetR/AcrR family transcriptional regulator [Rhodococcus sp. IEGM 1366]MDV8071390.1 TetR/AcrR family transcriptional regulator [Rhodococcus sp. IEGM 1366]
MPVAPKLGLRDAQKNLTFNRLVDAAAELLNERGAFTITMDDVAKAAGVSRATVYSHFQSKSEITEAIAQRLYDDGSEVYGFLGNQPRWTRDSLRWWMHDVERRYREHIGYIGALSNAGPASHMRASTVDTHSHYVDLMLSSDDQRWGDLPVAEIRQRCLIFVLHVESFCVAFTFGEFSGDARTDPTELLLSALCHLLGPALADY